MSFERIPRIKLGSLPTPLDDAPRLAEAIGLKRLLIKRDDFTGMGLGGNKVRKLEFMMADAVKRGCDVVLTIGGPQSNHARLTAAAAAKLGMESILFLGGPAVEKFDGNLLLDVLFEAEIKYIPDASVAELTHAMNSAAAELERSGRKPYVVPFGGSTPHGALGYTLAINELAGQLEEDFDPQIVVAAGSGGTLSGMMLGVSLFLPGARVVGIRVAKPGRSFEEICLEVGSGAAELIGAKLTPEASVPEVYDEYLGEAYGIPTEAGNEAIRLAARTEALVLDPVYTGKAFAGLIDLTRKGVIDPDRTVVFFHTGGCPALFANDSCFSDLAKYSELDSWRQCRCHYRAETTQHTL